MRRADASWARTPEGVTHRDVTDVAIGPGDQVFLFTRFDHQVLVYEPDGAFVRAWGRGVFTLPHALTVGPDGSVYCVDAGDHSVRRFTPEGELLQTIGTPGEPSDTGYTSEGPTRVHRVERVRRPAGPFNRCTDLAVGPDGDLYVSDGYGNCRVHRFSPDGELRHSWGAAGTGPGEFHLPHGLDVTPDGRVLVADRENDRVQVFDADGRFLTAWTDVRRPCALTTAPDGAVYVAELWRPKGTRSFVRGEAAEDQPGRVTVLDPDGRVLDRWDGAGEFIAPHGIARDSRGDVYVAEVTYSFAVRPGLADPSCGGHQLQKFEGIG
ncbi:peptidyl-alpha-hydroxyglycine alpha-amidating lyase family protein [Herbidospora yilanensis]|uniref:peptidyl-alpha-hydroxyglycine alpha-amidating lyase family protein n=1 Tax=Herbidospora yilanensis TaxID=354426 RepID=UPI000782C360|nr:peptidyl-alpha-hydroxyglycine alpha-amidating lyase family protein [Herbidospora yilanensis]